MPRLVVLDGHGRVLGAWPRSLRSDPGLVSGSPDLREALQGRVAVSNAFVSSGHSIVEIAVPFRTRLGTRVFAMGIATDVFSGFVVDGLSAGADVQGARSYLLDGLGRIVATTAPGGRLGAPLGDRSLWDTLRTSDSGVYGASQFVSATVPETIWRVVFIVPAATLYSAVSHSNRAAWLLFCVLVAAIGGLLALGAVALRQASRLAHERLHDPLTGLPNRALFIDRTTQAIARAARENTILAVLFVDLDRFKPINDQLGHAAGDALLVEVAWRARESVRAVDTVSRFGGDEFLIMCEAVEGEQEALTIAARVHQRLAESYLLNDPRLTIDCSIGIALHEPDEPSDCAELIRRADQAMYTAKDLGGGATHVITKHTPTTSPKRAGGKPATATAT